MPAPPAAGSGLPAAPTGLTLIAISPTTVRIRWTDRATNEVGYDVLHQQSWTGVQLPPNVSQFDWTGLTADTDACFMVGAFNDAGSTMPWPPSSSDWACVRTLPRDPRPAAPSNLRVDAIGAGTFRLRWTDNSSNETSFRIERTSPSGDAWSEPQNASQTTRPVPVTYETVVTYCYRIQAYRADTGASSPWTSPACADSRPFPNAPTIVSATAISDAAVRLVWLDNSAVETGYRIVRLGGGEPANIVVLDPNTTSRDMTGLAPGTNYCFTVMSFNAAGSSGTKVCVTTESAPTG